jgi:hypothetical protein
MYVLVKGHRSTSYSIDDHLYVNDVMFMSFNNNLTEKQDQWNWVALDGS